jgi:hypothetical protein
MAVVMKPYSLVKEVTAHVDPSLLKLVTVQEAVES